MLEQLLRKWAQKGFWQYFPSRLGPATSEACNANDLIKCMWKQGLIFNSLCKWWMHPCQKLWPNGLRRSWNRSRMRSQRLLLGCQTWLPWLLWGIWLQAGMAMRITQQGLMIFPDKDPSCWVCTQSLQDSVTGVNWRKIGPMASFGPSTPSLL